MLRDKNLAFNTALLTISGLAMRFVGMIWQVWLAARIGEAGIGLFQLIMSVNSLAATVAVSGIRYTATRLVSEETGRARLYGAAQALGHCMAYGLFFGCAAGLILMFLAEPLGFLWLGDARTVRPLILLAFTMPLLGTDSVMHGYFTAVGRVWKSVTVSVLQQLVTIAATVALISLCPADNLEYACLAITGGSLIGETFGVCALAVAYFTDRRGHGIQRDREKPPLPGMTNRMLNIALPLAAAAYARSGLSTLQHLLVPRGLQASGLSAEASLSVYGVIQGMALTVVLFPSCLMLAVAELIVPKLTERQVQGRTESIRLVTEDILYKGLLFSAITAALLLALGDSLGLMLYDSEEAGRYIQLFALIVPVMYIDMATDGCLKGLGDMMFCMYVNIADAGLSALLVWLLLPRWGVVAYIFVICFTEIFNFILSIGRLKKMSGFRLTWKKAGRVLFWAVLSGAAARALNSAISAGNGVPALIISMMTGFVLYGAGVIRPEEAAGTPASE
ncbi:MAG: oligosaccharide flippase family protein [Oscillospiraceae bacterium]|nr:oligosaccharide flippase family protein [Oscillospiraceae bacterium]